MNIATLTRLRWAVRGTLALGVAASVAANILHAVDNPISQAIAAWPPLALLLTVELISRIPVHNRWMASARLTAATAIAGIAAWVSYWHMAGVTARYGETGGAEYLLPLTVDGLIVVASVSLVELAGRIRAAEERIADPAPALPDVVPEPAALPVAPTLALVPPAPAEPTAEPTTGLVGGLPQWQPPKAPHRQQSAELRRTSALTGLRRAE